jgi:hypothetical protein
LTPENEYRRRLEEHRLRLNRLAGGFRRLWIYLFADLFLSVLAVILFFAHRASGFWIAFGILALIPIARLLKTTGRKFRRARKLVEFYEFGAARFRGEWHGAGIDGLELEPGPHVSAADLNLLGRGSLFELLCTARTGVGRATLANWLLYPADAGEVVLRQEAVTELLYKTQA